MSDAIKKEEINRGTQDDLEILKMIIEDHPGLKKRILAKMKVQRALNSETVEESMARRKNDTESNSRERKRGK